MSFKMGRSTFFVTGLYYYLVLLIFSHISLMHLNNCTILRDYIIFDISTVYIFLSNYCSLYKKTFKVRIIIYNRAIEQL